VRQGGGKKKGVPQGLRRSTTPYFGLREQFKENQKRGVIINLNLI